MDTANNVEHWRTIKFNVGYRVKKQKKKKKKNSQEQSSNFIHQNISWLDRHNVC